jgi:site-specific DNA recombinase
MRAGIYLRISKDFTGERLGVSRQLEDCAGLAEQLGWEVTETYTDNDVSASSGKVRPDYKRMLADIDAGRIDGIIAWHPDRLYRVVTDLAGTVDLTTPTGRLVAGLLAQVATYEGEAKADRWKRSWRQGREAGLPAKTGSRLFGYTREGELIPEEATIARRMVDDVLSGHSIMGISRRLQDEGVLTTRGTVWRTSAIRQYLANPRIAGYSTLKGEIVAEGQWDPIVDKPTWEGLRALLEARHRPYVPRVALLNGLVYCGECGTRLITGSSRGKRLYRCPKRPGFGGCGKVSIYAAVVDEVVEGYAEEALKDQATRARVAELRAEPGGIQNELAELEMRVTELEQQLDEPGTPVSTILRAIERTKEKQEQLLAELGAMPSTPLPEQGSAWPADLKRRRALVDLVVQRVEIAPAAPGSPSVERVQVRHA